MGNLVGTDDIEGLTSLSVSPNPNDGFFQIVLDMDRNATVELKVFNAIGQEVYRTNEMSLTDYTYQLDLTNEAKGNYWISLKIDGAIITRMVTVN